MRSTTPSARTEIREWELETSLPSLASQAAAELDNLLLGKSNQVDALRRLSAQIAESIVNVDQPDAPGSLIDPSAVVVMHRAIGETNTTGVRMTTIHDLIHEATRITQGLESIGRDPEGTKSQAVSVIEKMRDFCLVLSRLASAHEQSVLERRPSHPFRR
jgi:C4-dicarboxylate-specific signal transduction histidine kinase